MLHVIAYDIGTTGVKTGLISVGETVELVADAYQGYDLYILENGGAEQNADQWWSAMCETTRSLMKKSPVPPDAGASSSGQGRECSQTAYELHGSTGAKGNEGLSGAWHPDRRGQCQNADEEPAGHPCGVYQRERSALEVQVGPAE